MPDHTNSTFIMHVPTRLLFGAGQLENLHRETMPGRKAMIVISNGKSTRANGYLDRLTGQLEKTGVEYAVFDRVEPNPLKSTVNAGGRFAREHGCDFIIALGGGSCMDAAKSMALMAVNSGDYWDYIPSGTGKGRPVANRLFRSSPLPPPLEPGRRRMREPWSRMRKRMKKQGLFIRTCFRRFPSWTPD